MHQPLRLAFAITELDAGGAENCLVNLAVGLDRARFAPVVYALAPRPTPPGDGLVRRLEAAGVETHFLNASSKWQFWATVARLAKLLRDQRADVVQSFLFHANVIAAQAARRAGIGRLCLGIRVADPSRWRMWMERQAARRAERIVCVSESVAEFCRKQARFPAEKLTAIPNGVDVTRLTEAKPIDLSEWGIPAGRRLLAFIGRLDRQKGLDLLLPELPRLWEQLPEHELLVVGDGPQRATLQALAGADNRVHFVGRRSDVPQILAAADILVCPSRYEGMPNVVLEAMAAAKPVVAMRAEGVCELLGPEAEAQTAARGDWPAFRGKLVEIAHSREFAARLGAANRARAQAAFSLPGMIDRYQRLYESLASIS